MTRITENNFSDAAHYAEPCVTDFLEPEYKTMF